MGSKAGSASKVKLNTFDDLFGGAENTAGEQIIHAKLADLHTFRGHPFRVLDDEKMEETTESIGKYGVLVPGIVRPRAGGGYEMIAGHRRKRGSERAGLDTMPVIVRDYTDDEATIIMVDSNIQREDILPSEKARAYAMKYEAMKHQGSRGGSTLDEVGEAAGESGKTVQRYVWLARLSDNLLDMVDKKKIGIAQGVDISFLTEEAQQWVFVILEETGAAMNASQSAKLKEYGKSGELTPAMVRLILAEEKPKERKVTIKGDKINRYFPEEYSNDDIEGIIIQLLEEWQSKIATLKERISGMEADIQTAKANLPADKEEFFMKVGDKAYTDKKEAGAALVEMCKETKTVNVPATVGEYAGFKMAVSFDSFNHKFVMNLKGQLSHNLEIGSDPLGNIARINHALESMPKQLAEAQTKLETVERQLETAKVEVTKPFAQEAELAEKLERLSALNALLNMDEKGDDALGMDDAPEEENEGQETSGHDRAVDKPLAKKICI